MQNKNINLIIFIAIIVFINLVSLSVFTRLDFSKGNIYSLADASKKAVENIDDRLIVKAYFSENLPGQYADARRYTEDLLSEYRAYSHGSLHYEFVDPANEEVLKEEAHKNQIFPVSMRVVEDDKLEIREVYMGLAFLYRGKTESIPMIENTRGLEYEITRTIKKITSQ
ncbi:MAG: GldG family protein, partial [Candidatus Cloacimonadota bacterium]|nr:GldG family protein [Candidatus Cloacimonadota bacterium]